MKTIRIDTEHGGVTLRLRGKAWYARRQHLGKTYEERMLGRTEDAAIDSAKLWVGRIVRGMADCEDAGEAPRKYVRRLFCNAKKRATAKKVPYELTLEQEEGLYLDSGGQCSVTGMSFRMGNTKDGYRAPFAPSLDRINPKLGYTIDNVRLVCVVVNWALSDWGEGVFRTMCVSYAATLLKNNLDGTFHGQ